MTREEIKQAYSMKDILVKCGLPEPNRAGFIKCPFHKGDHEASMKIYDKDFHCFGCGANGDIFTFTEKFYGISFKDAFLMLGGEYEKNPSFRSSLAIYRAKKEKLMREKQEAKMRDKCRLNNDLISVYREFLNRANNKEETKFDILYNIGFSVGLVVIEMIFVIFMAICTENFQLKTYIMYAGLAITGIIIIYSAVMLLKQLIKKIRK